MAELSTLRRTPGDDKRAGREADAMFRRSMRGNRARRCGAQAVTQRQQPAEIDTGEAGVFPVVETDEIPVSEDEVAGGWRDQEKRLRERMDQ